MIPLSSSCSSGPPTAPDIAKAELDQLQEKHLANIRRLADEGKILKAGPFEDYSGRNVRGMFILKTDALNPKPVSGSRLIPWSRSGGSCLSI